MAERVLRQRRQRAEARGERGVGLCPVGQQPRLHLGGAPWPARHALEIGADHVRGRVLQPALRELGDVVDEVVVHAERRLQCRAPCAAWRRRAGRRRTPSRWRSSPSRARARCSPTASRSVSSSGSVQAREIRRLFQAEDVARGGGDAGAVGVGRRAAGGGDRQHGRRTMRAWSGVAVTCMGASRGSAISPPKKPAPDLIRGEFRFPKRICANATV